MLELHHLVGKQDDFMSGQWGFFDAGAVCHKSEHD